MAPIEGMPEKVPLPWLVRVWGRVDEVDDVPEPETLGAGVVLEQAPLGVEPLDGVRDAALDRLRDGSPIRGRPISERLARLVGALQHSVDEPPVQPMLTRGEPRLDRFERGDERRGAHVRLGTQPRQESGQPFTVLDGHLWTSRRNRPSRSPARS
ncbi:hypothetical protein ABZW11_06230 [Nonomuraea sp. NPDC004580]|uniref:hypothetical protein n=1 Tax=Nonomuraea sp. NPDC004580 TaxID=3154552 RepID=UPI0033AD6B8A